MYSELARPKTDGLTPQDWARNPYAGKTIDIPRPDRADPECAHWAPRRLKEAQGQWDAARGAHEQREQWLADSRAAKAAEAADKEAKRAAELNAKSDADRAATLGALRDRYLRTPGTTLAAWDKLDHDKVLSDFAMARALSGESEQADQAARAALARIYAG